MRRPARALVAAGAALLLGAALPACGPPASAGTVTLGTIDQRRFGDTRWVDIAEGQDLELAPGAQGGFHLWLRFRTTNLQGRVRVRRQADRIQAGRMDRVLTTEGVFDVAGSGPELSWTLPDPIPNFMCPTPIGINVIDQLIEMRLSVEDAQSAAPLAEGRARVTARCPGAGDPQRDFCLQICSG